MWGFIATWPFAEQAAVKAAELLENGADALEAAIEGIHLVESDPEVESVGKGGFLNEKGELAMDAAVMDGNTLKTGAVCCVRGFEHPVDIARAVMEKTRHNIIAGEGAEEFARKMGIEEAGMEAMITDHAREAWRNATAQGHDTIGAIALDERGKLAVATSTSGANMKIPGRVGDTPIIGSGFYVDSNVGGAAATGMGEDIMRTCCSFRCVEMMRMGMSPKEAAEYVVRTAHESIQSRGYNSDCIAVVCMNNKGEVGGAANHKGFFYAYANENTPPTVVEVIPVIDKDGDGAFFDGVAGFKR